MEKQIDQITKVLQEKGFRLTGSRQAIIKALVQSGAHISADDLVQIVHESDPYVGRMTVYRTLELLCELNILRPVYQGTGAAHYILFEDGHHHHLICSNCAEVVEFDDCFISDLQAQIGRKFDFQIEGHLLELYGLCANCH